MIDLGRDGDVWILRMTAGENRFTQDWLDAVRAALDQVEAAPGRPRWLPPGRAGSTPTAWTWTGWPPAATRPPGSWPA